MAQLPVGNVANVSVTPAGSGNSYLAGTDYILNMANGIITRASGGAIAPGATVNVAYTYSDTVTAIAAGSTFPMAPTN